MINLREVQAELKCARASRIAVEASESEIGALVLDMQNHAWQRVALVDALMDESYDTHLFKRPH